MHYVTVEGLGKSYGIKPLFSNISFHINEGDKIALIARNGSGKSTLLRILSGTETAEEGKVWINKDVNTVLFEQDPQFSESSSILDNIFAHNHPVINAIKKYEAAEDSNDPDKISEALIAMDDHDAWDFDSKVKQILTKLNIHHLDQKVGNLSGGQRKRVALARTLIDIGFNNNHSLLIMDEPTNHLDVEMVEWLEHYLDKENITLLLVTHDRYFLDVVCNEIWELDNSKIYVYKGDYQNYVEKKAARIESEMSTIDKAKNTFRKELEWMRKQPRARTTKSKSRQDNFYEIEKVAKRKIEDKQLDLQMKMSRLGGKIAELKKVYKKFGDKIILNGLDYTFKKGERVGIIGRNGAGKSTLLKILSRVTTPTTGKINIKGRVASLLEVGTGFHPELTGRENIYLNGAILGMRKREIDRKLDEIIEFSGVERFIDTPVKRYSSGMFVRLAFAVSAFLESEILIVDEVLAVGDAEFQKKCIGKMSDISKGDGRTILFVSHNLPAVKSLCRTGCFLEQGELKKVGEINLVLRSYLGGDELINNYSKINAVKNKRKTSLDVL